MFVNLDVIGQEFISETETNLKKEKNKNVYLPYAHSLPSQEW